MPLPCFRLTYFVNGSSALRIVGIENTKPMFPRILKRYTPSKRGKPTIQTIPGDAVNALLRKEIHILCHGCNEFLIWGSGIAGWLAGCLPKHYPTVATVSCKEQRIKGPALRGRCFVNRVSHNTWLANLYTQEGIKSAKNPKPFKRALFVKALKELAKDLVKLRRSTYPYHIERGEPIRIAMPIIGAGLGGGTPEEFFSALAEWKIPESVGEVQVIVYAPYVPA